VPISGLMKTTVVDENGDVRCPRCGAKNGFTVKRTGKAKLGLGLAVGVGALAAPKRLQCQGCGVYLKQGPPAKSNARHARNGRAPKLSVTLAEAGSSVVLDAVGPRKIAVIKVLRDSLRLGLREVKELADGVEVGPSVIGTFSSDDAAVLVEALCEVGATAHIDIPAESPLSLPMPSPEAADLASADVVAGLERLGRLHADGLLTAEEFAAAKQRVLDRA